MRKTALILILHDTVEFPVAFWGAVRAGIIPIPVNTLLTAEQYAYLFVDSRAAAAVVAAPLAPTLLSDPRTIAAFARGDGGGSDCSSNGRNCAGCCFSRSSERSRAVPFTAASVSDDVAFWMYTSGSTGDPKAVKHVHTSAMAAARLMGQGVIGICEDDVAFSAAKLSFSYGLGNALLFPMSVGASAVLLPERPTAQAVLAGHPPVPPDASSMRCRRSMRPCLRIPTSAAGAGSDRLRLCISAGEALPANLGERWREVVGVDVLDGIGSTEMLQTFLSNRPGDVRYGSTGKPVPGYEVKIVDERGAASLPPARSGSSWCAARRREKVTGISARRAAAPSPANGFTPATNIVCDGDGYYHYCGRTDDMFKVNGMWVSPFEVEAALVSHEAVLEAAVIGKADGDGLIKPKAFIVLKNGYCADDGLLEG